MTRHGYCFSTARGREYFDNSDCWIKDQADVELSEIETHNVDEIVEVGRRERLRLGSADAKPRALVESAYSAASM